MSNYLKKRISDNTKPDGEDLTNLYQNNGYLFSYLSDKDNTLLTRNLENVLIAQFNKKEIFKNHLYINSLSIKHET